MMMSKGVNDITPFCYSQSGVDMRKTLTLTQSEDSKKKDQKDTDVNKGSGRHDWKRSQDFVKLGNKK